MPIKDGYQTAREIKQLIGTKLYVNAKIIGYTGLEGPDEEQKCLEVGMDGYLLKPASEANFSAFIQQYID